MNEVQGIDVSHYQKGINWKQVAGSGRKFAILKCMYEAQSHRKDEYFELNYKGAGENGLARGVYIFIASASIRDPEGDAKSLLKHLADRPLEYGIWLDYEAQVLRQQVKQKIRDLTDIYAKAFRSAGYYTGIYCNRDWYINVIHPDLKKEFDFWIARYPKNDTGAYNPRSTLRPTGDIAVAWQYSSKGRVPGITGDVDLDVDFDGRVDLRAKTPIKKSAEEIALEVMDGKWGTKDTHPSRREMLERAGYNYREVQKIVNRLEKDYNK